VSTLCSRKLSSPEKMPQKFQPHPFLLTTLSQTSLSSTSSQWATTSSRRPSSPKSSNYDPGKCGPIRPNLFKKHNPSCKTNRSIKNQINTSQSATMKSSMKDSPTLSTWHQNSTIPAMQTPSTMTKNLHINSTNLNLSHFNLYSKKSSIYGPYDVGSNVKENKNEPDESNNCSEPNIPTYNRFEALHKLSKDPSEKAVVNDEKFELPVQDPEYSQDDADSDMTPKKRGVIAELNLEQLRTYLAEQLKPVQM
jgi:hypothetical protein